jgi:methyl-accepting chemotaxis protein
VGKRTGSFTIKLIVFFSVLFLLVGAVFVNNVIQSGSGILELNNILCMVSILLILLGGIYLIVSFNRSMGSLTTFFEKTRTDEEIDLPSFQHAEFSILWYAFQSLNQRNKEKIHWLTSILDAIPFPLSVTDMDMNWTFINRPVENLLNIQRSEIVGQQCSNWNANICKTENCGIARLRKNLMTTFFDQMGGHFRVDTSYLYNTAGEKIGHVEAVQDISTLVAGQRYQTEAVDKLSSYLEALAGGNLCFMIEELPPANENTQEVRKNFEKITDNLGQAQVMLGQALQSVLENANQVSEAAKQLAQAAEQSGQATTQISTTMQQVAHGTAQQSDSIGQTADIMAQVSGIVKGISKGVQDQKVAINKASEISTQISSRDGITDSVNMSARKVQELGVRSEKIGEIVETIEDIASQTNLLALNAAIEAARAGEHGKGFAVVADEVRNLAERASSATKEIGGLIEAIQVMVQEAVEISTKVSVDVTNVSQSLDQAIVGVSEVADENEKASDTLRNNVNHMMNAIDNIASVSEENSASTEEVSASAEEMSAQVEEVTASAQSLEEMAAALQEAIGRFEIE